ncbi:MAG: hypothetical protein WCR70_07175 [Sphaerochaetaceae bacterium]
MASNASGQLTDLANVIDAVKGKKTTTTTTTRANVSDSGVQELINQMLAGPGGVKSIGTAARRTGLYNSTTEERELANLYSSAAVKAELARTPTTMTQVQETPGIGLEGALGAIGASQLTKMMMGEENLISSGVDAVKGWFGMGGGEAAAAAPVTTAAGAGGAAAAGQAAGAAAGQAAQQGALAGAGNATMNFLGANALPLAGSFLTGALGGKEAAKDETNLAMSALMGGIAMGPMGLVAAPVASLAGGYLADASVICTALTKRGYITKEFHATGEHYLDTLSMETKEGYWAWAKPIAKKIDEGSKFWIKVTLPVVKSYISFVAIMDKDKTAALKHPLGALAHTFGTPFCYALGQVVVALKLLKEKFV